MDEDMNKVDKCDIRSAVRQDELKATSQTDYHYCQRML